MLCLQAIFKAGILPSPYYQMLLVFLVVVDDYVHFCLFQFSEAEEAKRALDQLNGFELAGRLIKVGHVTERTDNPQDVSLLDSDELERTGIGMTQTGRLQLMAKLAEGKKYMVIMPFWNIRNSSIFVVCCHNFGDFSIQDGRATEQRLKSTLTQPFVLTIKVVVGFSKSHYLCSLADVFIFVYLPVLYLRNPSIVRLISYIHSKVISHP